MYVKGRRSPNISGTFYDFTPAGIFPVRTDGLSAVEKIPILCLRLGGRDGWRDAEERGEGIGWREKERGGAQQLAPFSCHYPWSLFQSAPFDESQIVH